MAIWSDHLLPRVISVALNTKQPARSAPRLPRPDRRRPRDRRRVGLNVPFYPKAVAGCGPSSPRRCAQARRKRIAESTSRSCTGLDGQRLDLPDERFDAVLSTGLSARSGRRCRAAGDARVLKPGGTFRFVEHGRSPDAKVARMQDRIGPCTAGWGGCKVTREFPL